MPELRPDSLRILLSEAYDFVSDEYALEHFAIEAIGVYLLKTRSSLWGKKTGEEELISIEYVVNNWYIGSLDIGDVNVEFQENLEKAANLLGDIVDTIGKELNAPRGHEHFAKIRQAGKCLKNAADLLL